MGHEKSLFIFSEKTLTELIAPVNKRIEALKELLSDVKPEVFYNAVPITDPFGPSIVEPDLECIIVSEETLKGGEAVNKKRREKVLVISFWHPDNWTAAPCI